MIVVVLFKFQASVEQLALGETNFVIGSAAEESKSDLLGGYFWQDRLGSRATIG
jgi:hypothetical protein